MSIQLSDPTELDSIIKELDSLLTEGYVKQRRYIQQYREKSTKRGFNLDQFLQEKNDELNDWYGKVVLTLERNFTEKYHLFHFVKQKRTAMSIVGVPERLGEIIVTFESHIFALEDIVLRLVEMRNLAIRQEIAEKEYQADILYKITFSEHTRIVKLNNIQLANPKFDSKAMNFFEFIYPQANKPIEVAKIEEATGMDLANNIQDILRDLGFTGAIRQIFFPVATKQKVLFMNPIAKSYAIKNDLPTIVFSKLTRHSES